MNDLKFAFRQLVKHPGFTAITVLTLALGIGACTTIFSVLDAVLLRPLPFPEAHRLVQLHEVMPEGSLNGVAGGVFLDWREHQTSFDDVALINPTLRNLQGDGAPERLEGLEATHEFLQVLGLQPVLGRGFRPEEDRPGGDNHVVLLTEEEWQSRFGGALSAVGQTVRLDGVPHTIIGVLPRQTAPRGVWSPFPTRFVVPAVANRTANGKYSRSYHWASVYGRLKLGVSVEQADRALKDLKRQLNPQYPGYKKDWSATVQPLQERVAGPTRPVLLLLMTAVSVVLLISCANVANLMLVRAWSRRQEVAVRAALGATASRILRQVLTESILLSALAGIAGVLLAVWGIQLTGYLIHDLLPIGLTPQLDWRVLLFSVGLALVTGLLAGLLPGWQSRRPDLTESLKSGGNSVTRRGRFGAQSALVVAEIALTVVLLAAGGLLLRSLANAIRTDPGFEPARALAFDLALPELAYPDDNARFAFSERLLEQLRALPAVDSAGTGMGVPFSGGSFGEGVGRADAPPAESKPIASINYVSPGYLEALGVRLLSGRSLLASDDRPKAARAIVINEATARRFFPNEDPVGRKLSMLGAPWEIVGVSANVPNRQLDTDPGLMLYVPHVFNTVRYSVVLRTKANPLSLVGGIRQALQQLDPALPLANVRALDESLAGSMAPRRVILALIGSFSGIALLLACLGIYGVMSYAVATRRRELSIRLALGAARHEISGLILREASLLAAFGVIIGLAGTLIATRLLSSQLYRVSAHDPLVLAIAPALVALVALAACWWPARRAATANPIEALRSE